MHNEEIRADIELGGYEAGVKQAFSFLSLH